MDSGRRTAFQILLEVEEEKAFSNLSSNKYIKQNNPENPAFVRELVYGVLSNKLLLDYYLNLLIPSGIEKVKKREKTLLRMGLYQLKFMKNIPQYAAVNETVSLAKSLCRGREGFINGVLRGYIKKQGELQLPCDDTDEILSVKYSFSPWIIKMWKKQYGQESTIKLMEASNSRPVLCIRVNLMKTTVEELSHLLSEKGMVVDKGRYSDIVLYVSGSNILDLEEYKKGLFSIQDETSVLACQYLEPRPGDLVIDTCASPGGKTSAIGEMMDNRGKIISCDIYPHKLELIKKQADRLGITIIETKLLDGIKGDKALSGKADKVLVDAPCSGLGVIRKKPEIKYKEQKDIQKLIKVQSDILNNASYYVKPNGVLLYSTCTINKDENDEQIEKFIKTHEDFEILYEKQFLPTDGLDGFFICKMMKKGK
jgi:16S rRNA (cytosine967-C5)-methyltransferase